MIYATARRNSDGLLCPPDESRLKPIESTVIQNAVNGYGGTIEDWTYLELIQPQFLAVRAAAPAKSYLNDGLLSNPGAPTLSSDKAQVADDGTDTALLSFDVLDAEYAGSVKWTVTAPDGSVQTSEKTAAAGVSSLSLTCNVTGRIQVEAQAITHGTGRIEIWGI